MTGATQTTIDDRPHALWTRAMLANPSKWRIRSALARDARLFAPAIVEAAEESVYAKEREALLRYKGIREEIASEDIDAGSIVVKCARCDRVRGAGSEHCNGPGCADPIEDTRR